ncbi:ferric reductase-like transmembrane domain-containing protein [Pseudomonas sp. NPDC089396]|uniref:ferric reductase-like transmembrane domain-containing protein n=1 Tax=Pseudomonas sp. NPDC089396 TaxID=3364461 RepID=UPI003834C101
MTAIIGRLTLIIVAPFFVLLLTNAKPGIGLVWDFANISGLFSAVFMLILFIYSGRPLGKPYYDGKFFMNLHRDLGYAATALAVIHIGTLLTKEPLTLAYLLPSASWTMQSGMWAIILLIFALPVSLPSVRKKMWRTQKSFKRWHYGLSVAIMLLTLLHIVGAGFYIKEIWKVTFLSAVAALIIFLPLLPRKPLERGDGPRKRNTGILASWLACCFMVVVILLAAGYALLANSDLPYE